MSPVSVAEPRLHPVVGTQLVRIWEPEGPSRAEVVLIHGIAEHTGRYEHVGKLLSEAGLSVRGADLVGWGGTGGRRGDVRDWAYYLDQVQALMEEVKATGRPTVLLGHSMGGLLALEYAISERPAPHLLVVSAPSLRGGTRAQRRLAAILYRVVPFLSIRQGVSGDQLSRDPAVGEAYFSDPLVHTAATVRFGRLLFEAMDRTRAAIGRLGIPTLVLHGDHDSIVPSTCTVELGELPTVDRRRYPKLRHELFNEPEGDEVIGDVIGWLDARLADGAQTRSTTSPR